MSSSVAGPSGMSRPGSRLENRFENRFETRPSSRPSSRASARPASSTAGRIAPASDAADLGRPRAQSRHSLPGPSSTSPGSGKRKRDVPGVATDGLLKTPIVIKPHPSSLTVKPRILHPLMLLPREHLPLSYLDLSQPHGDLPAGRLFESKIKILDLEGRLGSNILLARSETTRMVYAVERESNGLYVLCKLGSWVDVEVLIQSATVVCRERMQSSKPLKPDNATAAPLTTPSMYNENKRRRLAIDEIQSLVRKRSMSVIEKEPLSQSPAAAGMPVSNVDASQNAASMQEPTEVPAEPSLSVPSGDAAPTPGPALSDDPHSQPDAGEIFQNIRTQYIEALYHSKGSLAYFAKGPLSRARAAFHLDWDSNLDMNDLIDFLKGLVMTTVVIDKKYRETIPGIVATMKTHLQDSDNGTPKPKKRKAKKPRLGKDGLYPGEIDHVRRWWASHKPVSSGDDDKTFTATESKYHISCLRRRETQLQIILILEMLALEPLALAKGTECQLPGTESQAPSREASQEPSTRKRNKHNLPVLLDVHADRLCIWQSTTLDEVKAVAESQMPTEGREGEKPESANSDPLRDFCVDIIMPFFSARLPGPCDSLNRKLGGPVAQSPPKEKAAKPASVVKVKPGAPMKRPTALKRDKDRTLERALSVERSRRSVSHGPAATIALLRSASQTVIPGLKREASESSLMGLVPRAESTLFKERPSKLFARSVSLSGTDLKAQRKAKVEAELKDAISALKKPNRSLAAKDFVEAANRRATAGQLKKMKKPNRVSAVQVKATPANNRFKDVLAAEQSPSQLPPFPDIPPSSASVVPASTVTRKFTNRLGTTQPVGRVDTTPGRPTASSTPSIPATGLRPMQHGGVAPSSPLMARKAAPPLFAQQQQQRQQPRSYYLSVPPRRTDAEMLPSSPGLDALFETPVAPRGGGGGGRRERADLVDDTPIRSRLPLGVAAGDAGNRGGGVGEGKGKGAGTASLSSDGVRERDVVENGSGSGSGGGGGDGASIYQRLGWDTTDLDDIDDLL